MSNANQEIIEARLAAYIDDEIDVGERAVIEEHLQQNPQYRRLLDELRTGRQMLRALPRESAPPEFADAFFLQIERAGLLDGEGEPTPSRMRLDMWPRWAAAAAVVFLTVGLAGILYFMLPHHPPQTIVYVPRTAPEVPGESVESSNPKDDPARNIDQTPATPKPQDSVAAAPAAPLPVEVAKAKDPSEQGGVSSEPLRNLKQAEPQVAGVLKDMPPAHAANTELDRLATAVSSDPHVRDLLIEAENAPLPNAVPSTSSDAVVMVVQSSNTVKMHRELNAYLASHNIAYQAVSQPVELALNASLSRRREASAMAPANNAANDKGVAGEKVAGAQKKAEGLSNEKPATTANALQEPGSPARNEPGPALGQAPARPAAAPQERREYINGGATQPPQQAVASAAPSGGVNRTPSVSPAAPPGSPAKAFGSNQTATPTPAPTASAPAMPTARKNAEPLANGQQQQQHPASVADAANTFLLVRRLSPLQARELNECLSRSGEVGEADISRDRRAADNYRFADGANANVGTTIRPDGSGKGGAPSAADALAKTPAGNDATRLREEPGSTRGLGATTRSSNTLPLADSSAKSDARGRVMESTSRPSVQPGAVDADAERLIDVVIVVRNPVSAAANPPIPATAPTSTTQKAALPIPATQPARPAPFPLSK